VNQIRPFTLITRSPSALVALDRHRGDWDAPHVANGEEDKSVGSGSNVSFDFEAGVSPSEELNSLLFQIVPSEVTVTSSGVPPACATAWTLRKAAVKAVVVHPAATVIVMLAWPAPPAAFEQRCELVSHVTSSKAYVVPACAVDGTAKVAAADVVAHHLYLVLKMAFEPVGHVVSALVPKRGSAVGGGDVKRKLSSGAVRQCTATFVPATTAIAVLLNGCGVGGVVAAPTSGGRTPTAATARIATSFASVRTNLVIPCPPRGSCHAAGPGWPRRCAASVAGSGRGARPCGAAVDSADN
jgi:hypothetical protein